MWRISNHCVKYSVLVPRQLPQPTQLQLGEPRYEKIGNLDAAKYNISWWYDFSGWLSFNVILIHHI